MRIETSPEDIHGMHAAQGIVTTRGGMTSHAAVVARGMGRACVAGAGDLQVDYKARMLSAGKMVIAAGERSCEYARRIGVPESRVRSGYYGFDYERFSKVARERPTGSGPWPKQFLYLGRYVPQKDLGTLMKAYSSYRNSVSEPWVLTCCGEGVDGKLIQGVPGVEDIGFSQPEALPEVFSRHGAFVLASQFEPWGVVIAEAASSGLPVICTTACGAGADIVRPYYNGLVVAPKDVAGLARAMRWIHEHESELPAMGHRGQALAEAFSAEAWATRWHNYFLEVLEPPTVSAP